MSGPICFVGALGCTLNVGCHAADENTRAATLKTGEVDIAYLFADPIAADVKKTPGLRLVAPMLYGIYWLDFLDQWDPKSPWHDRRVRLAASLAIDRKAKVKPWRKLSSRPRGGPSHADRRRPGAHLEQRQAHEEASGAMTERSGLSAIIRA